ncbi:MAG: hypothetical protein D6759_18585 [Chloroflexi bacterium]|nr:MAG: hypothetical protein D6759_18585 [Chloroflexota bacterium]
MAPEIGLGRWPGAGLPDPDNFLFILPLVVILLAVGNRVTAKRWAAWEREHALALRLWFGLVMIGLGVLMLTVVIPSGGV